MRDLANLRKKFPKLEKDSLSREVVVGVTVAVILAILALMAAWFGGILPAIWTAFWAFFIYLLSGVQIPAYLFWFLALISCASFIIVSTNAIRNRMRKTTVAPTVADYKADVIDGVLWKWENPNRRITGYCLTCLTPLAKYFDTMEEYRHYHCETCKVERGKFAEGIWDNFPAAIQRQIQRRINTGDWKNSFTRVKDAEQRAQAETQNN